MEPDFKLSTWQYKVWKFQSGEIQVAITESPDMELTISGSILSSDNLLVQMRKHGA